MSDLKARTQQLIDGLNQGNLDVIDEVVHDDFVEHEALPPGIPNGKEAPRVLFSMMLAAFPDFRYNVEEMLQDGNKVVIRGRFTGTHDGVEFMGIPPTGNGFDAAVIDIMEYAGDKLIGHWGVMDNAAMMQQLGVGEPPG